MIFQKLLLEKFMTIGLGRRKEASAKVKLIPGDGEIIINKSICNFPTQPRLLGGLKSQWKGIILYWLVKKRIVTVTMGYGLLNIMIQKKIQHIGYEYYI